MFFDTRKFYHDTAHFVFQTLDIGLNYTETVDTGTKYIVGVVNSCLYFFAQYFLNFRVGRFLSYLVF